jgi:hypothetical protein
MEASGCKPQSSRDQARYYYELELFERQFGLKNIFFNVARANIDASGVLRFRRPMRNELTT